VEAEALPQIRTCLLLHIIKQRVLLLSAVTVSLHLLRFERRYPKENTVSRLKSNILAAQKILGWLRH